MKPIIRVDNVSKHYRLGIRATGNKTFREAVMERAGRVLKRKSAQGGERDLWALNGVSFEVEAGEVVGIIGRNGAGKSTLLKILSRITKPTKGRIELRGRLGSLLEVGTGFHPELTGRENIFLNGAIMGMKRAEIERRFDEIVAFSEISRFLETAVKHYSSGMYMRLAFAVAAHLDPEILVVDEVLAVGDAAFQRKCIAKMEQVGKSGRTILFVSHNMAAVRTLCSRCILLNSGALECDETPATKALGRYAGLVGMGRSQWLRSDVEQPRKNSLAFTRIAIELLGEQPRNSLRVTADVESDKPHLPAFVAIDVLDLMNTPVMQAIPTVEGLITDRPRAKTISVTIDLPPLIPGTYQIHAWLGTHYTETLDFIDPGLTFTISASPTPNRTFPHSADHGLIVPDSRLDFITCQ